eukprot:CAMPEP_0195287362 /NCGR_PEP_ID=MMETSP0707-20130614/4454_1 /TAXON_ID=33640 /ORGANISM="Asterionellopsis glacialis, Strain CCMP134" /LENGTH=647 /DNA_ID=CAMNT_0040347111 /DNA_START=220 /DNA_END=2163 /DNA_ORIENTATION=+
MGFSVVRRPSITTPIGTSTKQYMISATPQHPFQKNKSPSQVSDAFVEEGFMKTECDDVNTPPSFQLLVDGIQKLPSGSDIRGRYVDHASIGSVANILQAIEADQECVGIAPLTPFAAHCFGKAFATKMLHQAGPFHQQPPKAVDTNSVVEEQDSSAFVEDPVIIAMGRDPRPHGLRLCDAFARGAESVDGIKVVYTGIATTPAMLEFCRSDRCDGAVMCTASHLPIDKNGMKFFTKKGGLTKADINYLTELAIDEAREWHTAGIIPPTSGKDAMMCSEWVDYMPHYASTLKAAIEKEVEMVDDDNAKLPLEGLKIVLNSGNGSGGFFYQVLKDLGADVSASMNIDFDSTFPNGVPNPENAGMVERTTQICQETNADLGVMLDTDADRCGFVVPCPPNGNGEVLEYEPLNRNRLIALLATIFAESSPGCTVVTCSVTSEGLSNFLQETLGLQHVRYLKGYANVIGKAKELTESGQANAELAIETSGHCAMKENGYLDDGTYTACKIIGLLARVNKDSSSTKKSLLDLISDMKEMEVEEELRMNILDGSLESTNQIFQQASKAIEDKIQNYAGWTLDEDNLEGIRVRVDGTNGGFFMLRQSLHDPLISLQMEGNTKEELQTQVIRPLLEAIDTAPHVKNGLEVSVLEQY